MSDDALVSLAHAHAVDLEYHDIWGRLHRASPEALRAVFAAMGVDASSPAAAAARLQDTLDARWRETLPPAIVLRAGASPWRVRLHVDQSMADAPLGWILREEQGAEHRAQFVPSMLVRCGEGIVDGIERIAVELPIGIDLPLGYHAITVHARNGPLASALLALVPERCYLPPALERGRVWGVTAQLYAVRSQRNWGIGDYTDLRALVEFWGGRGASIIGLNPQHATYAHNPAHCSPYSPSSRLFRNWLYIDVEACDEFAQCEPARSLVASAAFRERLRALRAADLVDYQAVGAAKREVLELLYAEFRARELPGPSARALAFRRFQADGGSQLRAFALFDALQEHFAAEPHAALHWQSWPEPFRDPRSDAVRGFCGAHIDRVEFFEYLQWLADTQLAAAGRRCLELGLGVGLYEDLAVSADRGGAEAWVHQDTFALSASIGAPPDELNLKGQNWGLPPLIPSRLRATRYDAFIAMLRANMRHCGALRIDHVMALMRLYWVPEGTSAEHGVYVRYSFHDLLGLVALESRRNRCMVVGEDLGTVPDEVRHGLAASGVLSYRVLYFERDRHGDFKAPAEYPQQALVVASTHDLPTVAGWWSGEDIAVRTALDLYPDEAAREKQVAGRDQDRLRLLAVLAREGLLPPGVSSEPGDIPAALSPELIAALHAYLASTPAVAMTAQLEDVLGAIEQVNVPGTVDQYPNWRRRLSLELERYGADPRIDVMIRMLTRTRPPAGG